MANLTIQSAIKQKVMFITVRTTTEVDLHSMPKGFYGSMGNYKYKGELMQQAQGHNGSIVS